MAFAGPTEDLRLPPERTVARGPQTNAPICPESLSRAADNYDSLQFLRANEQYDAFQATEHEKLLAWIARLIKEDADHGGRLLTLSFDHSTSKVEASGAGLIRGYGNRYLDGEFRYFGPLFSTSLTCLDSLIERLAASIADHFRARMFDVDVAKLEATYSRRASTSRMTEVRIFWSATPTRPVGTDVVESTAADSSLSDMEALESLSTVHREPSYQTAPLVEYDPVSRERAFELFSCVEERVGSTKARAYKGSYSILSSRGSQTVAKIIIYENGLGRMNGEWPSLPDGVYVLIRAEGLIGDRIWSTVPKIADILDRTRTIGIAPKHSERFAYLMLSEHDREQIADLIQKCAKVLNPA
ncbi:MAG: hypothetical protein ABSE56_23915 [Bryobacteraceae bacterium]|jgi:hypothetical protein